MNIIDFVKTSGERSFDELPFSPADAAVLAQLSYLKFEYALPYSGATLVSAMTARSRARLFEDSRFGENQRAFFFEAAFSRRYQNMKIRLVRSVREEQGEVCFCGMVFVPEGSLPVVVFRGTDEYIVGWKEDFAMAYRCPVPSQRLSVEYLRAAVRRGGEFYICGHSKGGNLARYSAVNSAPSVRRRVKRIYDLDGPGFPASIAETPGYKELSARMVKLVPQKSFVGQLLQSDGRETVVESEGTGLLQHDIFKWHFSENGAFVPADGRNSLRSAAARINTNLARLSPRQTESFVDALFGILAEAEIDNLVSFSENWVKNSRKILSAYIGLDDETKELLSDTVAALLLGTGQKKH